MTAVDRPVLVVDNFDSFVYNLVQYLGQLGVRCIVRRNDAVDASTSWPTSTSPACCSRPGPGTPADAGRDRADGARRRRGRDAGAGRLPGPPGDRRGVRRRGRPGARSCCTARPARSCHEGAGVLAGLPSPFTATRYHSLAVEPGDRARRAGGHRRTRRSGIVMALRHRELPIEGVQFHPESVLTEGGHQHARHLAGGLRARARPRRRRGRRGRGPPARPPPPDARHRLARRGPLPAGGGALVASRLVVFGARGRAGAGSAASWTAASWWAWASAASATAISRVISWPAPTALSGPGSARPRCPASRRPLHALRDDLAVAEAGVGQDAPAPRPRSCPATSGSLMCRARRSA